jgi:hypothetical protein
MRDFLPRPQVWSRRRFLGMLSRLQPNVLRQFRHDCSDLLHSPIRVSNRVEPAMLQAFTSGTPTLNLEVVGVLPGQARGDRWINNVFALL